MYEVVRYRGKEGIYSWQVEQKGFVTKEDALKSIRLCETFHKKEFKYFICKEGTKLAERFEKNLDNLPKVCYIIEKKEK